MKDSNELVNLIYELAKYKVINERDNFLRNKIIAVYKHHKLPYPDKASLLKHAYCAAYLSYCLPIGIRDNIIVATESK